MSNYRALVARIPNEEAKSVFYVVWDVRYGQDVAKVDELFELASSFFPAGTLKRSTVGVEILSGSHYARMMAVHFSLPADVEPKLPDDIFVFTRHPSDM